MLIDLIVLCVGISIAVTLVQSAREVWEKLAQDRQTRYPRRMASHTRRFDRAMSEGGEGVLDALLDHMEHAHGWTHRGTEAMEAYALVQCHDDMHVDNGLPKHRRERR